MSSAVLAEGVEFAPGRPFPERSEDQVGWPDRLALSLLATVQPLRAALRDPIKRYESIEEMTGEHEVRLRACSDHELRVQAMAMRGRLRRQGFAAPLVGECFALIREAAARTLGLRHYETQLMAGWALLEGRLVEMATGEGKTFAATLPASTVAMAGYPVHVITVNDYLAERDAENMAPLYAFLGLDVGTVIQGMAPAERRAAYAKSIAYCTNKEVAFDYLKDKVALGRRSSRLHVALEQLGGGPSSEDKLVLRGLHFAIVDEADSVFIDEALTPLILSATVEDASQGEKYLHALALANTLVEGKDYVLDRRERTVNLSEAGRDAVAEFSAGRPGIWTSLRAREELVRQALSAQWLFHRDQHYVVTEGKVQIVDESTGRVMPDRSWERGLHQMIEAKEGCEMTPRRETLSRITYQRLFRRYLRLAGMTGTAREAAREIKALYRLDVVRIPPHKPSRRVYLPGGVYGTVADKWQAVADRTAQLALIERRPVLIGTRSVEASEQISSVLAQRGIEHALLNAKQDQSESEIIARAGEAGRVTVATNMAGRGTDIALGDGVTARGGLHVILTEYHESRRVDRQLFGRCSRQGDPGSCEAYVSLEDGLFQLQAPAATKAVAGLPRGTRWTSRLVHGFLRWLAQASAERRNAHVRIQNFKLDRRLEQLMAFSGRGE